jgi:hypothetical protein
MHTLSTESGVTFNFNSDFSGDVDVVIPGMSVVVAIPGSALIELAAKIATDRLESWVTDDLYDVILGKKR